MKTYLSFEKLPRTRDAKTDKYEVYTEGKDRDERGPQFAELGTVSWWPFWRQYVFHPKFKTLYSAGCLRELADFCESETVAHKSRKPSSPPGTGGAKWARPCGVLALLLAWPWDSGLAFCWGAIHDPHPWGAGPAGGPRGNHGARNALLER